MATRLATVFGASGFLGRHVVQRLAARGWQVRAAVRRPDEALFLKPMGDVGQVTPVRANIRVPASVRAAVDGADAVVNLVGILFESGKQRFDAVHVDGARQIAEAAGASGCRRLVHLSALGASAMSPSRYGRSKAQGEEAVHKAFPDAVVLRPSIVFGPQDDFFNRFAEMALLSPFLPVFGCPMPGFRNGRLDLYGDGGTKFQPVYVGDVADAVMKGIEDRSTGGKIFQLGGPTVYSFVEIMNLMLHEIGRTRMLLPIPFWLGSLIGTFAGLLPVPPITRDQVAMLRADNVVSGDLPTLKDLGIEATAAEVILPTYLDRYRRGGRFGRVSLV
ncbi:MAG: complex I NDUFA9 subunit family protein [Alphaproteobacteria bacterium]|nr:complex I NDUFA9 subunit family protein [Alphaproteobacteria bacterium]